MSCCSKSAVAETSDVRGVAHPAVLDLLAHDPGDDTALLVMVEDRAWDGSKRRLLELQEKFNTYMSFALDGALAAEYPALVGKPLKLRLACVEEPDPSVAKLLEMVRQQIAFQGIPLEVRVGPVPAAVL